MKYIAPVLSSISCCVLKFVGKDHSSEMSKISNEQS